MSDTNTIFDINGEIVGIFKHGVAWRKGTNKRLGEYDETSSTGKIYDNNKNEIASFANNQVTCVSGKTIGNYSNNELTLDSKLVGTYVGCDGAAAAAIALLFKCNE